jgi:hypothetical protein
MSTFNRAEAEAWLINAMTDAFNRSLNALEDAGAIDARKLRKEYCTGSVWHELVSKQMLHVAEYSLPQLELICRAPRGE